LLRLANQRFANRPDGSMPEIQMTQETLAQMTNLSRGSISLIVGDLTERGLISVGYRAIQLIDVDRLRALADGD
jgi:CRP-like cAMP-binding protein